MERQKKKGGKVTFQISSSMSSICVMNAQTHTGGRAHAALRFRQAANRIVSSRFVSKTCRILTNENCFIRWNSEEF